MDFNDLIILTGTTDINYAFQGLRILRKNFFQEFFWEKLLCKSDICQLLGTDKLSEPLGQSV